MYIYEDRIYIYIYTWRQRQWARKREKTNIRFIGQSTWCISDSGLEQFHNFHLFYQHATLHCNTLLYSTLLYSSLLFSVSLSLCISVSVSVSLCLCLSLSLSLSDTHTHLYETEFLVSLEQYIWLPYNICILHFTLIIENPRFTIARYRYTLPLYSAWLPSCWIKQLCILVSSDCAWIWSSYSTM